MKKSIFFLFVSLLVLGCVQNPQGQNTAATPTDIPSGPMAQNNGTPTPIQTSEPTASVPTTQANQEPKPVDQGPKLDESFPLGIGQSATLFSESLKITFVNVTEDSRCPKSVTCVWAGQVSVEFIFEKDGTPLGQSVLTLRAGSTDSFSLGDYTLYLQEVKPYPEKANPLREEYKAIIQVSKSPSTDSWTLPAGKTS